MSTHATQVTDDENWEELLNSEASRKFLAEQVKMAEDLLKSNTSQDHT